MMTYRFDSEPVQDITGGWYRACDVDRFRNEAEDTLADLWGRLCKAEHDVKMARISVKCLAADLLTEQESQAVIYRRVEEKNASAEVRRLALQRILDIVQETP